ncbi:hypothetical protein [Psychroserpens ponticola]|uniref:SGNH/GDSL hydrolase family protein n=1 Tax=Psychroserpens ponticola TaxID=2932268 RepID=A0ABY7RZF7_9FLAO|nr:hypothetical protein [Psychroserpens ponticola]WCO02528.1 hypothetical protein MUN68_003305 [Psychroserpens ponticola]
MLFNLGNDLYYKNYDTYALNFNNYLFADSHGSPLGDHTQDYNVYNFSVGADSYIDIKRKLNFLIESTTIDTIYLSADEHMLSPYREQYNNFDKSSYYTTASDFSSTFEYYKNEAAQKIIYFQPKTGAVIRKYIVSKFENLVSSQEDVDVKESNTYLNWNERSDDTKIERIKKRIETQFNYLEKSVILEETLLEIFNICETNNVIVIGVKYPLTKEYYTATKHKMFGVDSIFKDKNLKILDFQSAYIDKDDMFYNEDHLTFEGGELFVQDLFKELKQ